MLVTTVRSRDEGALRVVAGDALDDVRSSFLRLAERFRPEEAAGLEATWSIEIAGRTPTTIEVHGDRCLVSPGTVERPAARLQTDAATWIELVDGRIDGIAAFLAGRLRIEGDLNLALRLETLFAPGADSGRRLRTLRRDVRGVTMEAVAAGSGTPVLLLHGLGASKVSFLPTLDGLAANHEVHALDLPGFGKSDKPLPAGRRYTMAWMADQVHGYLIRNRLREAHVVGNSMGGRIALELALRHPGSVRSVVGLGSAVAFDEYQRFASLLRLLRPQWLGMAPFPARRAWIEAALREMFHDPSRVPADNFRAAADDVVATMGDRGYRLALLACARQLGAERAGGRSCFWKRMEGLAVPSYWVFGRHDRLVNRRYARRVEESLPAARVELWDDIGHVPQFEVPERTNDAVLGWLGRIDAGR
jgi:pimeloyl-ACP methyl ester carboxylesterase/putative sterol carrier protein